MSPTRLDTEKDRVRGCVVFVAGDDRIISALHVDGGC